MNSNEFKMIAEWKNTVQEPRFLHLLNEFEKWYSPEHPVYLLRVPARINLKGVHIEHRGGFVNYMAVDKEAIFIVQPRTDDKVIVRNVNPHYSPVEFSISRELPLEKRGHWLNYIQSIQIQQGHWGNYIKGGVLVLQDYHKDLPLKGMNILVDSSIPMGSGLSSSSSLVVGSILSTIKINQLHLSDNALVELCGKGEWYVGTRGGAGDHAAMIFCKKDHILHARFFPFVYQRVPFPKGYSVLMCNTLVKAVKSQSARNKFNEKVATYQIALLLIRHYFPEAAAQFVHLRDVLLESDRWIYQMLKQLPVKINRAELIALIPSFESELTQIFKSHDEPPDGYQGRNVCLFGLAECRRGEVCVDFLKAGDIRAFGELMYISHNGDRIVSFDEHDRKTPWSYQLTDAVLDNLIQGAEANKASALLYRQPGGYACSCEELDYLVDTVSRIPGVVGGRTDRSRVRRLCARPGEK